MLKKILILLVILTFQLAAAGCAIELYEGRTDEAREQAYEANIRILENAVVMHHTDSGNYPQSVADLVIGNYINDLLECPYCNTTCYEVDSGGRVSGCRGDR